MYKKLLSSLAALGTVAVTAASVVSCTPIQYADGEDGQRVVTVTDGGHINDHSFNEDALLGVRSFVNDAFGLKGENDYVESGGTDITSIVSGYKLAIMKKANAVVMPGFIHMNSMGQIMKTFDEHNINTVLVDGDASEQGGKKNILDPYNRVISIKFNSQISGFMAGFDTSYLFGTTKDNNGNLKYDTNGDGLIKIGTFAGATNKYGVDNYMWGLLLGMSVYNEIAAQHNKENPKDQWAAALSANSADVNSKAKVNSPEYANDYIKALKPNGPTDNNFWSNSYALGAATNAGIPNTLINLNKADVIFPVAGPQIQDIITAKVTSGRVPYLIGVDVDQEAAYPKAKGRFVTSAIKNIHTAVPEALYRAKSKKHDNTLKIDQAKLDAKNPKGDEWLGTRPEPFVDWSIDYTNYTVPVPEGKTRNENKYLLDNNFIKLYDAANTTSTANGAMKEINDEFASLDDVFSYDGRDDKGKYHKGYMDGDEIVAFAKKLVDKYHADFKDGTNEKGNQYKYLDWFSKEGN